ncbi:hydroxyacylglutathione hydrolase [Agitococcus lubricus]|uniref:Hydroxyacylglutathione hydrolase n=1 Tax=Agitococcus lubricus TaxID=1077255 RepID=A0A2T5J1L9_9GAMM|nr:hydroxyacylglutathione hydrolase [Agitococcus lubricus]PTQ90336.1 hydroxyacylglutathione hydrolase [Agitococcus lubricus]
MIKLVCLPMLADNYLWLMIHPNGQTVAIDVGDYALLADYLQAHHLQLTTVLITHRHHDHTQGIPFLQQYHPNVPIYGHPSIKGITHALYGGEIVSQWAEKILVMDVKGHTGFHLAYYVLGYGWLFCGDSLFSAGCGRIFPDGNALDFYHALEKIKSLPDNTRICASHEYTLSNIDFALAIEPDNLYLQEHRIWAQQQRKQGLATLPTSLSAEKKYNPFLRCQYLIDRIQQLTHQEIKTPAHAFAALRAYKDRWSH